VRQGLKAHSAQQAQRAQRVQLGLRETKV